MSMVKIVYRVAFEGSGTSLSSEKEFCNTKAARQYIRRNKISKPSIFIDGKLSVLIGNRYYSVSDLNVMCAAALVNSDLNEK